MKQALKQAEQAFAEDEVPIGAVLVADNRIIGKGYNQVERLNDPTAHAEMIAITAAANFLSAKYLPECDLYVTAEPCIMCFGALEHARIRRVYIGCKEPKHGFSNRLTNSKIDIHWDILSEEAVNLLRTFFELKRA